MQVAHQAGGRGGGRINAHSIIWHKFCIAMCGRNEASDPGHSAAGSAHNAVRNVFERLHLVCLTPALQPQYLFFQAQAGCAGTACATTRHGACTQTSESNLE